ncbi:MAG: TIM barrel protein [bacterium]|nr:TIM barrel protein [bacterium]
MKFAICNETWRDASFQTVCESAARLGYDGVEIAPFTLGKPADQLTAAERGEIKAIAKGHGLDIIGLHWLLVLPKGVENDLHINCPGAARRQKTQDYYKELIRLCAEWGGKVMVHGSPGARNWTEGDRYYDVFQRTVDFFGGCVSLAEECGVTICFEPLTHAETNFINRAQDGAELIEAVGSPNLMLHLDVKAMCGGEYAPPEEVLKKYSRYVRHVHANDPNKRGPGQGGVRYEPIVDALNEIGYDGYVSVEVFDYAPDGETIARQSIEYLKRVF